MQLLYDADRSRCGSRSRWDIKLASRLTAPAGFVLAWPVNPTRGLSRTSATRRATTHAVTVTCSGRHRRAHLRRPAGDLRSSFGRPCSLLRGRSPRRCTTPAGSTSAMAPICSGGPTPTARRLARATRARASTSTAGTSETAMACSGSISSTQALPWPVGRRFDPPSAGTAQASPAATPSESGKPSGTVTRGAVLQLLRATFRWAAVESQGV